MMLTLHRSLRSGGTQQAHRANHEVLKHPVTRPISLAHVVAEIRNLGRRRRPFSSSAEG